MYIIIGFKVTKRGIDINGARLYMIPSDDSDAVEILTFRHATVSGWESKKAIFVDFEYVENEKEMGGAGLEITNAVAVDLIAKYSDVKVKSYIIPIDKGSARNLVLAAYMYDPYDRG